MDNELLCLLRQFRHNNSDEFVSGFDRDGVIALVSGLRAELAECRARIDGLEADLAKTIGLLSQTAAIVCMEQLADVPAAVERLQADYRYMSNEYAALLAALEDGE